MSISGFVSKIVSPSKTDDIQKGHNRSSKYNHQQPPQKNTRTAVGLFSKNQSYLEMIHPPINWHSYGNPWVSS